MNKMQRESLVVAHAAGEAAGPVMASSCPVVRAASRAAPDSVVGPPDRRRWAPARLETRKLLRGEEAAALEFLNRQPLKNIQMIGLILDHGLEHADHRGAFYGSFDGRRMTGVALIGYITLLSGDRESIVAFAELARQRHQSEIRLLLGEESQARMFNRILTGSSEGGGARYESQLLFALEGPIEGAQQVEGLRQATEQDADEVALIHGQACFEQHGVNPMQLDPVNFQKRVLGRIRMGRVWIIRRDGLITFKADVASETDQAVYVEGVWTRPELRGRGIGGAALKDLFQRFLRNHSVICLLAGMLEQRRASFYQRLGFALRSSFALIRYRR